MITALLLTALALIVALSIQAYCASNYRFQNKLTRLLPFCMCMLILVFVLAACGNGK